MVERLSLFGRLSQILRLAAPPRWAGASIVALGIAAALLEGLGLVLFIPLLQSLGAPPSGGGDGGVGKSHRRPRLRFGPNRSVKLRAVNLTRPSELATSTMARI
jgi:hypothetical protein